MHIHTYIRTYIHTGIVIRVRGHESQLFTHGMCFQRVDQNAPTDIYMYIREGSTIPVSRVVQNAQCASRLGVVQNCSRSIPAVVSRRAVRTHRQKPFVDPGSLDNKLTKKRCSELLAPLLLA